MNYEYLVTTRRYLSIAGFKKMCQIVSHEVPLWISLGRWSAVHCHGRFSNLGTVCPPWNSNFVFTWDTVYILLPIAVEVCEVESLWSTTEGALYYNIARQAFPDFYGVVWGGKSLSTTKGALYYSIARQAFPDFYGVVWGGESLSTTKGAFYYSIARQAFPSCYSVVSLWASLRAIVIQHCQASFSQLLWFCVRGRVSEHL